MLAIRPRLVLPMLLACLAAAQPAHARWTHDPTEGVPMISPASTWYTVLTAENQPTLSDGAGGAYIAWTDYRQGGNSDVYVQHVDANGNPTWTPGGVPATTLTSNAIRPVLASDAVGGIVVVWQDDRNGNADLYGQRFNAAGVRQWTLDGVGVCVAAGDQTEQRVLPEPGGSGVYVVWTDTRSGVSDIYAQRMGSFGSPLLGASGAVVCNAAGPQYDPQLCANGQQGFIVSWTDTRSGPDIYAQDMLYPTMTPHWAANGIAICNAAATQLGAVLAFDGSDGAVIVWADLRGGVNYDLYAQRVGFSGTPAWAANGVPVSVATGDQFIASITHDVAGAVVIAWSDARNGNRDIYAQRLSIATGAPVWTVDGVAVCTEQGQQDTPIVLPDSTGGTYVVWVDERRSNDRGEFYCQRLAESGGRLWNTLGIPVSTGDASQPYSAVASSGPDGFIVFNTLYVTTFGASPVAHKIDRWGYQGAEPYVTSVRDVPNDQGGQVKVSWDASPLDTDPRYSSVVTTYDVYRSAPPALVRSALASGRVAASAAEVVAAARDARPLLRTATPAGVQAYWELIGSQVAGHLAGYSMVAPTTGDSLAGSNPRTSFMVQARNTVNYWPSNPDSGYSVDNLAPLAPAPFTGTYYGGSVLMQWNRNAGGDLAGYRLYRGSAIGFTPSPGNRIAQTADNVYMDVAGAPYIYKLTAVDVHGNESLAATLLPSGALDAGDAPVRVSFLAPVTPNPVRASAGAAIRFGLARAGHARLTLLDAQGRVVRALADADFAAGEHAVAFDGRGARGAALAPGLYLVRFEGDARAFTRRMIVIE